MATNVGTLQANLTLDTSNFTRGMGKAIAAAQRLGSALSMALGRKTQSFSTVGSSAESAATSMGALKNSISEVSEKAQEVSKSFSQMTSSISSTNPTATMSQGLIDILAEIRTISQSVTSLNTELTNTNNIIRQIKAVLAGNSNLTKTQQEAKKVSNSLGEARSKAKELGASLQATPKAMAAATKNAITLKNKLGEASFRAKDIKRILEGIVVSQAFYRLLSILSELVSGSIQFMQNMEQTELSFKYLLGDAQAAADLVEKLQDFAIASPLDTSGAAESTRYLLNMGFAAQNVVDVLSVITDAAVVSGAEVKETVHSISVALGQMLQSGTASAQEIRQLYNAGVPVAKILNEQLGLTGKEVKNIGDLAIDSGTVVAAILRGMKDQFAGASREMQETFAGAMSAIKDSIFVFANVAAEEMYGAFRDRIVAISNAMQALVQIVRKLGPGGVFETLVPNKQWQAIIRNVIGAFQQLAMAVQYWYKIIGTIFKAMGQELLQILNIILPPITIMANFLMKLAYGFLQAAPAVKYFIATLVLLTMLRPIISLMYGLWKVIGLGGICLKVAAYVKKLALAIAALTIAHPVIAAVTAITAIILTLTGVTQKAINKIRELIALLGGRLANLAAKNKIIDPGLNIGYDPNKILQPIDRETKKGTEDYAEDVEDVADALDDVTDSAKKAGKSLKNNFNQSFDEVFTIDPKKTTASDILGFDPEDLDLEPLEDFMVDLGGLNDYDFDFGGTVDNFMEAWRTMIDNVLDFAKKHIGELAIALAGLLAGLALGNPWVALAYALVALFWKDLCEAFEIDVPNEAGISAAIGIALGTLLGKLIGGKLGGYIGGVAGLLASFVFSVVLDRIAEKFNLGDYSKASSAIGQGIGKLIGAAIGGLLGGPIGAAIGSAIGDFAGGLVGLIWGGLVEKLGAQPTQGIADITSTLSSWLGTTISTALTSITGEMLTAAISGGTSALGSTLASCLVTGMVGGLAAGAAGLLTTGIVSWVGKELEKTPQDLQNAGFGGIAGSIAGAIIGLIITAITGGAGAFIIPLSTAVGNTIGQGLGLFASDISSWCGKHFATVKDYITEKLTEIKNRFANFDWGNPLQSLVDALEGFNLGTFTATLGVKIGAALGDAFNEGLSAFDKIVKKVQKKAWDFGDWLIEDVPNWFLGLGESIGSALGEAFTSFIEFFTITIPNKISNIDFEHLFKDLGHNIGYAIGKSLQFIAGAVTFVADIITAIDTFFRNLLIAFIRTIAKTDWSQLGKDILKAIGTALIDVFIAFPASVLQSIGKFVYGILDGFVTKCEELDWSTVGINIIKGIMWIFSAPSRIIELVAAGIANFFEGFYEGICEAFGINSPAEEMKPIGGYIIEGILAGAKNAWADIFNWVNNNIYVPAKDALTSWFTSTNFNKYGTDLITGIKNAIVKAWADIFTWINNKVYIPIKNALTSWFPSTNFSTYGIKVITGIKDAIVKAWSDIFSWINTKVYTPIRNALTSWFPSKSFAIYGTNVITGIKNAIVSAWANIFNWVNANVLSPIKRAFSSLFTASAFSGFGGNIISGLLNGIQNGLSNIWDWCRSNVYDRIYNTIKAQFGIASPAKKMMPLGDYISQGLGKGIADGMVDVISNVRTMLRDLMENFDLGENPLVAWADDTWSLINDRISAAIAKIKELMDLTSQSITLNADMAGFNIDSAGFSRYDNTPDPVATADTLADALLSRFGPILSQGRPDNDGAAETRRPLYVGTLIADERGLRELERKLRVITEAEDERRGR